MALHQERIYTLDDIYALPDGQRAELIDGYPYHSGLLWDAAIGDMRLPEDIDGDIATIKVNKIGDKNSRKPLILLKIFDLRLFYY